MHTLSFDSTLNRAIGDEARRAVAGVVFAAIYAWLLFPIAHFYWFVPAGWRFAALAVLPWRYWPWILGGEFYARVFCVVVPWHHGDSVTDLFAYLSSLAGLSLVLAGPLGAIPGSILLRRTMPAIASSLNTPAGMSLLLAACLVSALGETAGNFLYLYFDPSPNGMGVVRFVLGKLAGDYIGVIALAPALFALLPARADNHGKPSWRSDALLLAGCALAYVAVMRASVDSAVYDYTQVLVLVPAFLAATRHGWRGAAIALSICSLLVALVPPLHPLDPYRNLFTQMLLAMFGSASLLLGANVDAQRASRDALATQNVDLEHANRGLDRLGVELRQAAQRNLQAEEQQRRRLAAEIHDELGQNLTAVHTRLKLAANRLDAADLGDVTTSIFDILGTMRRSVHGLMDSLRPPALDEFGLVRALADGPLRDMIERAGLRYEFTFRGEPALIDALREDTQIAIWRIAQEASTNIVRHAQASRFDARLCIGIRAEAIWAILDLRDDGVGIAASADPRRRGEGLQGMRDRLLALDGTMHLTNAIGGTRLHVLLRQSL